MRETFGVDKMGKNMSLGMGSLGFYNAWQST
jgi:hypothetical protein